MHSTRISRFPHRLLSVVLILSLLLSLVTALALATPARAKVAAGPVAQGELTYRNEILPSIPGSSRRVETFADPSIIKAKDGFYYAYATKDPRFEGDDFHVIPIVRSNDLVHWTYIGDAFPNGNPPSADPGAGVFAPDIRYMNDQYYLYYSITNIAGDTGGETGPGGDDSAIGVATSPNPYGPFTDRGIVVEPTVNPCCGTFRATIDSTILPLPDGRRLIYYGSFFGGLDVRILSADGLRSSPATQRRIALDNRYEAPFVIRRGEFYYMFVSATDCCNFELTGYTVFAGRSRSPFGPFVDKRGHTFLEPRVGGTQVLAMNGNRFVGPGHNAVITDDSGQDYIVYHAIDRFDPEVRSSNGTVVNRRPLMIDRLDYVNGFPVTRARRYVSDSPQEAPVTRGVVDDEFNRTASAGIGGTFTESGNGLYRIVNTGEGGNFGIVRQAFPNATRAQLVSDASTSSSYRAEADVRLRSLNTRGRTGSYGLLTSYRDGNNYISVLLEPGANDLGGALVTNIRQGGTNSFQRSALPANFRHRDFHNVAVELRGRTLRVWVTESRLEDPVEMQVRTVSGGTNQQTGGLGAGRVGFLTQNASAEFDNLVGARLFTPVTEEIPNDRPGTRLENYSDEFNGNLDPENGWRYAQGRVPPDAGYGTDERNGYYRHTTDDTELFADINNARVLIENAPAGDFVAETKVEFNLPNDESNQAFAQAGLIFYQDDNNYVRLNHVAIFNTRQIEFNKETTGIFAGENQQGPPRGRRFGNSVLAPPETVTWLRIVRKVDPNTGVQRYTAYSSVDGVNYERGPTYTHNLKNLKIGLTAFNRAGFRADFDYIRVSLLASGTNQQGRPVQ